MLADRLGVTPDQLSQGSVRLAVTLLAEQMQVTKPAAVATVDGHAVVQWAAAQLELHSDQEATTRRSAELGASDDVEEPPVRGAGEEQPDPLGRRGFERRRRELDHDLLELLGLRELNPPRSMTTGEVLAELHWVARVTHSAELEHLVDAIELFLLPGSEQQTLVPLDAVQIHALRSQLAQRLGVGLDEVTPAYAENIAADDTIAPLTRRLAERYRTLDPDEAARKPTLSDIARLAGVTAATVSRAFNGRSDSRKRWHSEPMQRMLVAAQHLGVLPDREDIAALVDPTYVEQRLRPARWVGDEFVPASIRPQPHLDEVVAAAGTAQAVVRDAEKGIGEPEAIRQVCRAADEVGYWYHQDGPLAVAATAATGTPPSAGNNSLGRARVWKSGPATAWKDYSAAALPESPALSTASDAERSVKQAIAGDLYSTYGIEVLGLEKLSVDMAMSVRKAIFDELEEADAICPDAVVVLPLDSDTFAAAGRLFGDEPENYVLLNETYFGNPEYIRELFERNYRSGRLNAPTGDSVYDIVRHELAHLRAPKDSPREDGNFRYEHLAERRRAGALPGHSRFDWRHDYTDWLDAKAFGFLYQHFIEFRRAGALPPLTRFDDWLGQLNGYSRVKQTRRDGDRLFAAFDFWLNEFESRAAFDEWLRQSGLSRRDDGGAARGRRRTHHGPWDAETDDTGWVDLKSVYDAWLKQLDSDTRSRIVAGEEYGQKRTQLNLGTVDLGLGGKSVFDPTEALAEANNAFGKSAPKDFTHPVYVLQALLRGIPLAQVWRDVQIRTDRANDREPVPAASGFDPSTSPDGVLARSARRWRDMRPDEQRALEAADTIVVVTGRDGRKLCAFDELARLVERQQAERYGATPRSHETAAVEPLPGFAEWEQPPTGELGQWTHHISFLAGQRADLLNDVRRLLVQTDGLAELLGLGAWAATGAGQAYLDVADLFTRIQDAQSRPGIDSERAARLQTLLDHLEAVEQRCESLDTDLILARAQAEQLAVREVAAARGGLQFGPRGRIIDGVRLEVFEAPTNPSP